MPEKFYNKGEIYTDKNRVPSISDKVLTSPHDPAEPSEPQIILENIQQNPVLNMVSWLGYI